MTDPLVELESTRLKVDPGGQVAVRVTVRNVGHIIEGFTLDVLGEFVTDWAEVSPPELRVDVDQEASAVVVFTPPAGAAPPTGSFPFAVRARSLVDPSSSAVVEGDIDVGRVFGLTSKISPVTSSGRWSGRHRVTFTNWGNSPVQLRVEASDPDERLGFLVAPQSVAVPLGATSEVRVKVRTRKPFLRGTPVRLPFEVVGEPLGHQALAPASPAEPPDSQRQTLAGVLMQKPIINRWVVVAATMALVAAVAGVAFVLRRSPPLDAPKDVVIGRSSDTAIILSWLPVPGADGYTILEFDSDEAESAVAAQAVQDGDIGRFAVNKLKAAHPYCFEVKALKGDQESAASERQCGRTSSGPDSSISEPTGLQVLSASTTSTSLTLTWDGDPDAAFYQFSIVDPDNQRVIDLSDPIESPVTQYEFAGLDPGVKYCFQIAALAASGRSSPAPEDPVCDSTNNKGSPATSTATTPTPPPGSTQTTPVSTPSTATPTISTQTTSGGGGVVSTGPTTPSPVPGEYIMAVELVPITVDPTPLLNQWKQNHFPDANVIPDWTSPDFQLLYVAFGSQLEMQTYCGLQQWPLNLGNVPHTCDSQDILQVQATTPSPPLVSPTPTP